MTENPAEVIPRAASNHALPIKHCKVASINFQARTRSEPAVAIICRRWARDLYLLTPSPFAKRLLASRRCPVHSLYGFRRGEVASPALAGLNGSPAARQRVFREQLKARLRQLDFDLGYGRHGEVRVFQRIPKCPMQT